MGLFTRHKRQEAGHAVEYEVTKTEDEWKAQLPPERYRVLRRAGTEPAWSGELLHVDGEGCSTAPPATPNFSTPTPSSSRGRGGPASTGPSRPGPSSSTPTASLGMVADRDRLRQLRRPPRARLSRRPHRDRYALLREFAVAHLRTGRRREGAGPGPSAEHRGHRRRVVPRPRRTHGPEAGRIALEARAPRAAIHRGPALRRSRRLRPAEFDQPEGRTSFVVGRFGGATAPRPRWPAAGPARPPSWAPVRWWRSPRTRRRPGAGRRQTARGDDQGVTHASTASVRSDLAPPSSALDAPRRSVRWTSAVAKRRLGPTSSAVISTFERWSPSSVSHAALLEPAGHHDPHALGQGQRHVLGQVPPADDVEE